MYMAMMGDYDGTKVITGFQTSCYFFNTPIMSFYHVRLWLGGVEYNTSIFSIATTFM